MSDLSSHLPITARDLEAQKKHVDTMFARVQWTPKAGAPSAGPADPHPAGWRPSTDYATPTNRAEVSLLQVAKQVSNDPLLLDEAVNHVLREVRTGLQLGLHLATAYGEAAGLVNLVSLNRQGRLTGRQQSDFYEMHHTSTAIALFSAAEYIRWALANYRGEEAAGRQHAVSLPELVLDNPLKGVECQVFYYAKLLEGDGVRDGVDVIKATSEYFDHLARELRDRVDGLRHREAFENRGYRLEGTDFVLKGFAEVGREATVSVEFNRVEFTAIVGNRAAKHAARRMAQRLVCYDVERARNPFLEIGGLPLVRMGYGKPGTGKSLQIAATATLLQDYCAQLGIPFLFWPLPDNLVSTFQGGSAERAVNWMLRLQDKDKIVYAPIDDAENNFEERTRQGVSAGVREIIGVFLRYTEGAYAIKRGNAVLEFFTNLPEQIDKAVLSRIQARFPIDGAASREDFLDQDHLWWRRIAEVDERFIRMKNPRDYAYLAAQAEVGSLTEIETGEPMLHDERLAAADHHLRERHELSDHDFFAHLFIEVLRVYPTFSSRDVRNIQQAVNTRLTDFDLPEDWFGNPEVFFRRDYDSKVGALKELMRANMKGLSFAEIRYQEAVKYINNLASIANQERDRDIARMTEELARRTEAQARFSREHDLRGK